MTPFQACILGSLIILAVGLFSFWLIPLWSTVVFFGGIEAVFLVGGLYNKV